MSEGMFLINLRIIDQYQWKYLNLIENFKNSNYISGVITKLIL